MAKWIEKNGEGIMLIGFNVENTRAAARELEAGDYRFIPDPSLLTMMPRERFGPSGRASTPFFTPGT